MKVFVISSPFSKMQRFNFPVNHSNNYAKRKPAEAGFELDYFVVGFKATTFGAREIFWEIFPLTF
jgi:hypothetical protein